MTNEEILRKAVVPLRGAQVSITPGGARGHVLIRAKFGENVEQFQVSEYLMSENPPKTLEFVRNRLSKFAPGMYEVRELSEVIL